MQRTFIAAAVVFTSALATTSSSRAETTALTMPAAESPAVAQGKRFLDAAASADDDAFLRTVRETYPTSTTSPEQWLETRSHWRQWRVHEVERSDATHAELSVFDAGRSGWVRVSVTVQPDPPHAITDFSIRLGRRPADIPAPPRLDPPALIAAARTRIAEEVAADHFAGAVIVARGADTIFAEAHGLADIAAATPNTLHTRFRIGSMGKMFTAVAIMQLAQAGKIDLAAPIGRYLPGYPNAEIATKVTVDELLVHAGGTGDIFGPEFEVHRSELKDPKDYVAFYGARAPLFPPGSRQDYSNYGYILLGRIVETVSGLDYDDFLQRHIFGPAGMTGSGALPETVRVPGRAVGYADVGGKLEPATRDQVVRGTPAGGSYSTVGDMVAFADALMSRRLLDASWTDRLLLKGTDLPGGGHVRYDFGGTTGEGRRFFGHAGGAPGQSGDLRIFPDDGYTVVVLANRDPEIAGRLTTFIGDRLPVPVPGQALTATPPS